MPVPAIVTRCARIRCTAAGHFYIVVFTTALWSGCEDAAPPAVVAPRELAVIQAKTVTLQPERWPVVARVQGSLMADEVAVLGAKVAGRVETVLVDLGDRVEEGEELVRVEQIEFEMQVAQATAQLAQARAAVGLEENQPASSLSPENAPPVREQKATWDESRARSARTRQLYDRSAVTESDLEQVVAAEQVAQARYASAINAVHEKLALIGVREAELSLARQRLQDAVMRAPFRGTVQQRHVAPGSFVQVGQAQITLVRTDPLRFQGTLPERFAQSLAVGQQVRLRIHSVVDERDVTVTRVSPSLDPLNRALTFEAEVSNPDSILRTGLFGEAEVVLNPKARSLAAPLTSVVEFAGTEKVWKLVDGVAREQLIETGERRGDRVLVRRGLEPGDVILVDGKQGQVARVEPVNPPSSAPDAKNPLTAKSAGSAASCDADDADDRDTGGP